MPTRVDNLRISIRTGPRGAHPPVRIRINGFALDINRISGGTGSGEDFEGEFYLGSVAHSLVLLAPPDAPWDVRQLEVELEYADSKRVRQQLQGLTLTPGEEVDLLSPPPHPGFEV